MNQWLTGGWFEIVFKVCLFCICRIYHDLLISCISFEYKTLLLTENRKCNFCSDGGADDDLVRFVRYYVWQRPPWKCIECKERSCKGSPIFPRLSIYFGLPWFGPPLHQTPLFIYWNYCSSRASSVAGCQPMKRKSMPYETQRSWCKKQHFRFGILLHF